MNWFKENKFLGGLLIVTLILAGLIIFVGLNTSSSAAAALADAEQHKTDKSDATKLDPFPTEENVSEKKKSVKAMIAQAEAAQSKFLAFRPESLDNITVSTFADRLKNADANVRALYDEKNVRLSEKAYLGFEDYKGAAPIESATGILAFELAAIEWLFIELANSGVNEVTNFRRDQLAEEKSAPEPTRRGSSSRRKKSSAGLQVAKKLPMSLTFKGSEKSVRDALQAIGNSDQFFFETRASRVQNPAPVPTSSGIAVRKAPVEVEAPAEDDGFGVVEDDGEDAADAPAADPGLVSEKILHRVAGGEDVSVFVKLDLLLFDDETNFPAIK